MTGFGILSFIAGALQLSVPSYALRLVRLFGTRSVGWFLVAAFSSLALVHLLKPMLMLGSGPAAGLSLELVCALASMLLLIGMGHMEILLSQRQLAHREAQRQRSEWERQVKEQTASLAKANQELVQEIATRAQEHKTLKEAEAQYRFLFLEHPQPMWIFDLRTLRFLAVNRAALRHYGFSAQELLALTARELLPAEVAPAFLQDAAKPCTAAASRGQWPLYKKDQTLVRVEMTALDLRYDQCPARLVLATDVSQRQQCEQDSRQAEKRRIIRQVTGSIAHHFNDLLACADNQISLVLEKPQDPKVHEQLRQVFTVTNRAAALNRQLLMIGGCYPMAKELLDINRVLENLIPMLRGLIGERIVLHKTAGGNLPPILADPRLLEHILVQLVRNARDAMPNGGALTLSTAIQRDEKNQLPPHSQASPGAFICLAVRDTGCGMTPETQAHLFEPFFTTRLAGKNIGLGLASLNGVVEDHSGWVEFSSSVQTGTEFRIFFPCAPHSATSAPLTAPSARSATGETILLVQAEEQTRGLARYVLSRQGYHVIEADNAATVLALWEGQAPSVDLLLTDLVLPGECSGPDLANQLRQTKPHLKVLFSSERTDGQLLSVATADPLVSKPYSSDTLLQAVQSCLARNA